MLLKWYVANFLFVFFFVYICNNIINLINTHHNFQVHTKKRNRLHQKKMNDLVFVMHNLKLGERQKRKIVETSLTINDLPSDDEWIADEQDNSSNEDLLNILSTTSGKEIVEDDAVEEVREFHAIDIDAVTTQPSKLEPSATCLA